MTHGLHFTTVEVGAIVGTFGIVAVLGKPGHWPFVGLVGRQAQHPWSCWTCSRSGALLLRDWHVVDVRDAALDRRVPAARADGIHAQPVAERDGGRGRWPRGGFREFWPPAAFGSIGTTIVPLVIGVAVPGDPVVRGRIRRAGGRAVVRRAVHDPRAGPAVGRRAGR